MTSFILKLALPNMNGSMPSQEPTVILTLTSWHQRLIFYINKLSLRGS